MIFTYRTRQFLRKFLQVLLVLLMLLALALVFFAVWLRRYVVYTPDGVRLDFSIVSPSSEGKLPSRPQQMDVHIEYTSAASFGILEPMLKAPSGLSAEPFHKEVLGFTEASAYNAVLKIAVNVIEAQTLSYHKALTGLLCRGDHFLALLNRKRHRLFGKNVLARLHKFYRILHMQKRGQTNIRHIEILVCKKLVNARVGMQGAVNALISRRDIDIYIIRKFARIHVAKRHESDRCVFLFKHLIACVMRSCDATEADYGNLYFFHTDLLKIFLKVLHFCHPYFKPS